MTSNGKATEGLVQHEFDGRLEINGVYYLEEDKINEKLTTKKI